MGRYEILLNTPPEVPEKIQPEIFGPDTKIIGNLAFKYDLFHPDGTERLIGLLFKDPKEMFIAGHVHFTKKWGYFLCKTVGNNKQYCCEKYPRGRRIGCAVISYESNCFYRLLFGKKLFEKIQELHSRRDLTTHDMYLKRTGLFDYNVWIPKQASQPPLWKTMDYGKLSKIIEEIHSELPRSLGKDLPLEQIMHDNDGLPRNRGAIHPDKDCWY